MRGAQSGNLGRIGVSCVDAPAPAPRVYRPRQIGLRGTQTFGAGRIVLRATQTFSASHRLQIAKIFAALRAEIAP